MQIFRSSERYSQSVQPMRKFGVGGARYEVQCVQPGQLNESIVPFRGTDGLTELSMMRITMRMKMKMSNRLRGDSAAAAATGMQPPPLFLLQYCTEPTLPPALQYLDHLSIYLLRTRICCEPVTATATVSLP